MKDHERKMQEAMAAVFNEAASNALAYGIGIVKISHINGLMEFSAVDREEFMETAEHLQWLDKHAVRETKQ